MARTREPGTPRRYRAAGFLQPANNRRLLIASLMAGAAVMLGAAVLYVGGARQALSPGNVAAHHARIDLKCAQCHDAGAGVEALRCERCHDPVATGRLLHAAHVLLGSGDSSVADRAETLNCAQCHNDHRGREALLRDVSDLECSTCHSFRSLQGHPEFAALRDKTVRQGGMDFDHDRHVVEAEKARGATCQTCHEQTSDRRGFQPMTFDRNCASCHLKNGLLAGETDFIPPDLVLLPADVPADRLGASRPEIQTNPRGRHKAAGLRHRDEWVLYNAARLRHGIDREGEGAERVALRSRISYLEQLQRTSGPRVVPAAQREAAIDGLRTEIAELDRRIAAPADGSTDEAALAELATVAQSVMASLQAVDPGAPVSTADSGDFEARRSELVSLLDAVEQRGGEALRVRVAALRQRVLELRPGTTSLDALLRMRRQRQRLMDRYRIEQEIDASPADSAETPSQDATIDRAELDRTLQQLRARLAEVERAPTMPAPASEDERQARSSGLESLLTPCLKCHQLDSGRSRLAPVQISGPVMRHAMFNHAPHTTEAKCESCHTTIRTSKLAADVNLPAVASCRTCHQPSQMKSGCATCHLYHPPSAARLTASASAAEGRYGETAPKLAARARASVGGAAP